MATCPVCERREPSSPTELATGVCAVCAKLTGVHPLPPARRPAAPCQRCNRMSFVRAMPRTFDDDRYAPLAATFDEVQVRYPAFGVATVDAGAGRGLLELYICRGCGFVEWYCQDPTELPIGPAFLTENVDYEAETPYR